MTISGDLSDTVTLPVGDTVTYEAVCTIDPAAGGSLTNTATVSPPAGVTDPASGNDSATDIDTLAAEADLAITKDDGQTTAAPGETVTYTIEASNAGPSDADDATVTDAFPAELTCSWSCASEGGAICAGPDVQALAVRPSSSNVLFAGTDEGLFRSLDGTDSWSEVTSGLDN
ncbi:MAG: DUF11 domain-containing protein, partial [Deltaproteobacteria bacterium]|nr:DUF11 domain-containing protein [Deltaproteobacteria bacterium]